jgi:hypothetical protein
MLLVIESREDLMPVPTEEAPRSTATALRHMGWPFPVDEPATAPTRARPARPPVSNVVALKPVPTPVVERDRPRRMLPLFQLELAEAR